MKLALIRQRFTGFGGAERYVHQLAHLLIERGHDVHILARQWDAGDIPNGLKLHRINSTGGPSFVRLSSFAKEVASEVHKCQFDLVHSFERTYCQDIYRAGDGCHKEWLFRRARARGIIRAIADRANPRHRTFLELEARLFRDPRLKIVLANSKQGAQEIIEHYGLPEHKVRVVYNGLDRTRFHPGLADEHRLPVRRELNLESDEPVVLFVGSGYLRKGLGELIQSLPYNDARLLVVGRDRPGPFQRLANKLGVLERIRFLGPRSDVHRLYGAADVFCLPSWYEPFSNACLEAMAAGLPVVTARETGAAEVIRENVNGFILFFPVRPEDLGDRINRALKIDRSKLISTNDDLLKPFNWETNVSQTLAAYEELLG